MNKKSKFYKHLQEFQGCWKQLLSVSIRKHDLKNPKKVWIPEKSWQECPEWVERFDI